MIVLSGNFHSRWQTFCVWIAFTFLTLVFAILVVLKKFQNYVPFHISNTRVNFVRLYHKFTSMKMVGFFNWTIKKMIIYHISYTNFKNLFFYWPFLQSFTASKRTLCVILLTASTQSFSRTIPSLRDLIAYSFFSLVHFLIFLFVLWYRFLKWEGRHKCTSLLYVFIGRIMLWCTNKCRAHAVRFV